MFFFFRTLLTQDYGFLQKINLWSPFVTIGIYCSSLSAAMCAMIGASRILHALAGDQLFGEAAKPVSPAASVRAEIGFLGIVLLLAGLPLAPAAITSNSGNPWVAVLYTWGLAQVSALSAVFCCEKKINLMFNKGSWPVVGAVFVFQCVVFAGQLNAIASLVTVFYLLAYAAVDLACLALEWASAPNFRYSEIHFNQENGRKILELET